MNKEKIDIVKTRIKFVKTLTELSEHFTGFDKIENIGDGWDHPYRHYEALRFYLLLTCFDILGSEDRFIPFATWLASKKLAFEKERAVEGISFKESPWEVTQHIYRVYNSIYGSTQGFKRFIIDEISDTNKTKLLNSVQIRKISNKNSVFEDYSPSESEKVNFLYEIRNSFTHAGQSYASPSGGLWPNLTETGIELDGIVKFGFSIIYVKIKPTYRLEYAVRRWPTLLIEIIEETIEEN